MNKAYLAVIAACCLSASEASAAVVTYTSSASYFGATVNNTVDDFDGYRYRQEGSTSIRPSVTFFEPGGQLFLVGSNFYNTGFSGSSLNEIIGSGIITVTFDQPVYGFAANFGILGNWGQAPEFKIGFAFASESRSITIAGLMPAGLQFVATPRPRPFRQSLLPTQRWALVWTTSLSRTTQQFLPSPNPQPG